jgi:hypothetical protein
MPLVNAKQSQVFFYRFSLGTLWTRNVSRVSETMRYTFAKLQIHLFVAVVRWQNLRSHSSPPSTPLLTAHLYLFRIHILLFHVGYIPLL